MNRESNNQSNPVRINEEMTISLIVSGLVLAGFIRSGYGCTTFAVGRKATVDGSVMATHSNDGGGTTDGRLIRIPAQDYPPNSLRPIWNSPENYPRYVGTERGAEEYFPENCLAGQAHCHSFSPIGYIPQVNHTFAYFEGTYGILNEKQVGIAESTCSGIFAAKSIAYGGKALLSVDQLSQIAMERASSAKEAVKLMGALAEQYGFYGESDSFEGGSESLIVTDPSEAWVFHILADSTGTSAIWGAARVPDDSISIVPNMFVIRYMNVTDTDNYLVSSNIWDVLEGMSKTHAHIRPRRGMSLYVRDEYIQDFTYLFSDGEYGHKYYSGRRVWGLYRLFAPSAQLSPDYVNLKDDAPYPFSFPVDQKLSPADMFRGMRDWYNDTPYSLTQGLAAGAFGTPDRYSGGAGESAVPGNWERSIALYRSSDSYVVQCLQQTAPTESSSSSQSSLGGVIWWGPGAAHSTVYVPVFVGNPAVDRLNTPYQGVYNVSTLYWVNRNILTTSQVKFSYMYVNIHQTQLELEAKGQALVNTLVQRYGNTLLSDKDWNSVYGSVQDHVNQVHGAYTGLWHYLFFTYADGYVNYWSGSNEETATFHSSSVGYPAWWLEEVGYPDGPPPTSSPVPPPRPSPPPYNPQAVKVHDLEVFGDKSRESVKKCVYKCQGRKDHDDCVDQCFSLDK